MNAARSSDRHDRDEQRPGVGAIPIRAESGLRVAAADFGRLPLRTHDFLHDVPLHDAWRIRLRGGARAPLAGDALELLLALETSKPNPAVRTLFALRGALGRVFGWDEVAPESDVDPRSFLSRVLERDRTRSLESPGTRRGPLTVLFMFEDEVLVEVINGTVHAFISLAVVPGEEESTLFWGIYVRPVSRLTPHYMALIDPFRRWIVYPALIRRFEASWEAGAVDAVADHEAES